MVPLNYTLYRFDLPFFHLHLGINFYHFQTIKVFIYNFLFKRLVNFEKKYFQQLYVQYGM